jgi:hypothetical protein
LSPAGRADLPPGRVQSALTFILAFGAVKAVTNSSFKTLSDRYGRKPVLVAGGWPRCRSRR